MSVDRQAWTWAVLTYGLGDVLSTHHGLQYDLVEESHPLSEAVLELGGTEAMIAVKILVFLAAYAGYSLTPEDWRVGIPIGLALLGTVIVANNAVVIAAARSGGE